MKQFIKKKAMKQMYSFLYWYVGFISKPIQSEFKSASEIPDGQHYINAKLLVARTERYL